MENSSLSSNLVLVQDLYDAFGKKDETRLRKILHPEVEWIQCAGFPGGGHRRSADEVLENVLGGLNTEWKDFQVLIDEYLEAGRAVVVIGRYAGRHSATDKEMEALFAHVYEVEDGRIIRFRQIADTAPMVDAMRG
jgi:ketosteroid isomerase-like protein